MSNRFKSALFSGFNRRDVVSYITDQAKQKEALSDRTAELEAQIEELRAALDEVREENLTLQAELAVARQRADEAEETCRGLQKAVRSSLTELNALSGTFDAAGEEAPEAEPAEDPLPETEDSNDVPDLPEDAPADLPTEEADAPAEEAPPKKRTVEIRRHERI